MAINPDFFADFSALAGKPRAHKMHPPGRRYDRDLSVEPWVGLAAG